MCKSLIQNASDSMRIYVLWHPHCSLGGIFAREIYKWFRGNPADIFQCGYGIPVLYRNKPFIAGSENPREIELSAARINIIVPLVDQHMVLSTDWRRYLRKLADNVQKKNSGVLFCPVALHSTAFYLPENISRLNFLRIDRVNDPSTWNDEQRCEVQRQRLLSLLTQVCCRLLGGLQDPSDPINLATPAPEVKIFISHAKADGTDIAEMIRDQIYQQGQLEAFFDESDLAIAYEYESALIEGAQHSTAAMVAVFTDAYSSRPWCRREIRMARKPRSVLSEIETLDGDKKKQIHHWRARPLIIVDALESGDTHFLPEFGYAPVFRWNPDQVSYLIDQMLREILLYRYNEERAKSLPIIDGRYTLNCIPDMQTILQVWHELDRQLKEIVIPPPGLPLSEQAELKKLFDLEMKTFDEIERY